ncbi:MAG: LptA/OstA family protein [Pseudomonadota bacterium]
MTIFKKCILPTVCAAAVFATLSNANAQSFGGEGLSLSSDEPVQVEGNKLEIREEQGIAIFDGNVKVVQGDTILRTGKLVIRYNTDDGSSSIGAGEADIERLDVSGGVNIQTGEQVATGDKGFYDMVREVFVLTGKRVTLSEGGNVATGCKLTVTMSNSRARLEGCGGKQRPTILIQPKSVRN